MESEIRPIATGSVSLKLNFEDLTANGCSSDEIIIERFKWFFNNFIIFF